MIDFSWIYAEKLRALKNQAAWRFAEARSFHIFEVQVLIELEALEYIQVGKGFEVTPKLEISDQELKAIARTLLRIKGIA